MDKRHFLGLLAAAPLACLCARRSYAGEYPFRPMHGHPPRLLVPLPPELSYCGFEAENVTGPGGGVKPPSRRIGADGRHGTEVRWSFSGAIAGVRNPGRTLETAFDRWAVTFHEDPSPLSFARVGRGGDITIGPGPLDADILATTSADRRAITFNEAVTWNTASGTGTVTFLRVAMHEIGHALGLPHSPSLSSIMLPMARGNEVVSHADMAAIRSLYS